MPSPELQEQRPLLGPATRNSKKQNLLLQWSLGPETKEDYGLKNPASNLVKKKKGGGSGGKIGRRPHTVQAPSLLGQL